MKKHVNSKYITALVVILILIVWQIVCWYGLVSSYMLPSPLNIAKAFVNDFDILFKNAAITLTEAVAGLILAIILGSLLAIFMDNNITFSEVVTPFIVFTQTIPIIAVAPMLILWLGYGMLPKIVLVFISCFFPVTIGFYSGLKAADDQAIVMLKTFGAKKPDIYRHIKIPGALPQLFASVKVATSYAMISAVVAEWLGGNYGIGVYLTRVRKSYAIDKMFAAIFLISIVSLFMVEVVKLVEKKALPWRNYENT